MDTLFITKIVTRWVLPPGCVMIALAFALIIWRRWPALARAVGVVALLVLYFASAPITVTWLANRLEIHPALTPSAMAASDVQAIVVLGGGRRAYAPEHGAPTVSAHALERLRYAALLQRVIHVPIAVTGGVVFAAGPSEAELMEEVLTRDFGAEVRWREDQARNTEDNARLSFELLTPYHIERIALVSHAAHLYRAVEMFEQQGFTVLPAPTVFWGNPHAQEWLLGDVLPSAESMFQIRVLLHEWLGRVWYRWRQG